MIEPTPSLNALTFDEPTIRGYIAKLHTRATGLNGVLVVTAIVNDAAGAATVTHHKIGDVEGTVAAVMAHAETPNTNVYVPLHVMRPDLSRRSRGKESDIVAVLGLIADQDGDTGKTGPLPVEPSSIIQSSPGNYQPAILFDKPMAPADAKALAKALQVATGADSGTGDITHVWRVPGTINFPNAAKRARGRVPVAVRLIKQFNGLVYDKESLHVALAIQIRDEAAPDAWEAFSGNVETAPLWSRISSKLHELLLSDGKPDRSKHTGKVVEQCEFEGFDLNETISLCLDRPGAWTEKRSTDAELISDIERLWAKFAAPRIARRKSNAAAAKAFLDNEKPIAPLTDVPSFDTEPFDLDRPGGTLSKVARWIHHTSPSPIPPFAIMSAVSFHAGLMGRKWITPDGLGLNLYTALVARSGYGKNRPLKALGQIADAIGHSHIVGPNDIASDSAIEMILRHQPCQVLPLDELGMLFGASGKSSDAHSRARRKAILELYSSATDPWVAKVRASDGANGQSPKPKIQWPTLSFLGAATPTTFYEGLEADAFSSGLAARLIVVAVDQAPNRQDVDGYVEFPQDLIDDLHAAAPSGPVLTQAMQNNSAEKPRYRKVQWANDEAKEKLRQIRDWARATGDEDERRDQIVNRAGDHTTKLASIRALSRDPANPRVTADDIDWAFGIVWRSIKTVEDGVERYMSGSMFESVCNAIMESVRQSNDPKGLKNSILLRRPTVRPYEPRMISSALDRLINGTGQLRNVGSPMGNGGTGGRYLLTTMH